MTGPFSNALMTIVMENHDKLKKASDEPTDAFDTGMDIRDGQNCSGYDILQIAKKFEIQTIVYCSLLGARLQPIGNIWFTKFLQTKWPPNQIW